VCVFGIYEKCKIASRRKESIVCVAQPPPSPPSIAPSQPSPPRTSSIVAFPSSDLLRPLPSWFSRGSTASCCCRRCWSSAFGWGDGWGWAGEDRVRTRRMVPGCQQKHTSLGYMIHVWLRYRNVARFLLRSPTARTWVMVLILPSAALYSTVGPSPSSSFTTGCCFTRSKARLASRCSLRAVAESRGAARVVWCGFGEWC